MTEDDRSAAVAPRQEVVIVSEQAILDGASLGEGPERSLSVFGAVRHTGASPVSGAAMTLADSAGRRVGVAHSDHMGLYKLPVVTGGTYLLIASAAGYEPAVSLVAIADRPVRHDMTLATVGGLEGTVRLSDTRAPVNGATVTVTDIRGEVVGAVTTAPDGSYRFSNLPAGDYTLIVAAVSHQPVAVSVTVHDREPTHHEMVLVATGSLRGSVKAQSRPFEGARLTLMDPGGQVVANGATDSDGGFAFGDLPPGKYRLVADGYSPVAIPIDVSDGRPVRAYVTLGLS